MRQEKQKKLLVAMIVSLATIITAFVVLQDQEPMIQWGVILGIFIAFMIVSFIILKSKPQHKIKEMNAVLPKLVEALGGKENIVSIERCDTRVRLEVISSLNVNDEMVRKEGIHGVIKPSNTSVHLITKENTTKVFEGLQGGLND